jgi:hypothetical protein
MAHHSSKPFDEIPEALREFYDEKYRSAFGGSSDFGATGRFPQGKYTPQDEGEIAFGVAADKTAGKVIINFGKPTAWVGMDKEQALALAESLINKANEL